MYLRKVRSLSRVIARSADAAAERFRIAVLPVVVVVWCALVVAMVIAQVGMARGWWS